MKIKSLTFVTGNKAKAEMVGRFLNYPLKHKKLDLDEIQSLDLEKIVEHKVKQAYDFVKSPVLVEDDSLTFDGLGRLPGPLIRWFLEELDNPGLCKLVDTLKSRKALAEVLFGYFDGKTFKSFRAEMPGMILKKPQGQAGFGWDSIFVPKNATKSWAEMSSDEVEKFSIRKIALKKFEKYMKEQK